MIHSSLETFWFTGSVSVQIWFIFLLIKREHWCQQTTELLYTSGTVGKVEEPVDCWCTSRSVTFQSPLWLKNYMCVFFTLIQFYFTYKELNLNSSHIKVLSTVTERNPNNQTTPYERAIWRQWRGCGWEARDKTKGLLWKLARTHNSIQSLAITMLSQLIIV